jgi:hypothetical protein
MTMFDPDTLPVLRKAIHDRTNADRRLLDELCAEVRSFASQVRSIKPRSTTSISLVASDGGNNKLQFDPFYVQLVRVVDSYGKQLCFDAVSPTTDTDELSKAQFNADGSPRTSLGRMMDDLDIRPRTLTALSHMIPPGEQVRDDPHSVSPSWVLVYRDLCEWAVLYERICYHTFARDTLLVRDGLLRSKLFRGEGFITLRRQIEGAIQRIQKQDRRRVFLVGVAKTSKVITRYHLAMAIEKAMPPGEARYVRIPRELEAKAYVWPEYARGAEAEGEGEAPKYVAGDLFLVRFGPHSGDPTWAVDILTPQSGQAPEIFGYLLADAIDGFPVPFYPRCLQKAHEHAQIVDFDLAILQDEIFKAVRGLLPETQRSVLDALQLNVDAAARRYE